MDKLKTICDILNHHIGKSNKVTSSQMAEKIGIHEDATNAKNTNYHWLPTIMVIS